MPKVYEALLLEPDENNKLAEQGLTFEVEQQSQDFAGICSLHRHVGSSDGLQRGMKVHATGAETVPGW